MTMEIPVPVREMPHWRVNFRSEQYKPEIVPRIHDLFELVERTAVSFRGWNYPHISSRVIERAVGTDYVASWADFMGHVEYWRLYQSGQFIHLFSVPEVANSDWRNKYQHVEAPGIFSVKNFVFTITEIFEFAARLAQKHLYSGNLSIKIEIKQIRGFVLVTDFDRMLSGRYEAHEEALGRVWEIETAELILDSQKMALDAVVWFFERFGWRNPPRAVLESDQAAPKSGKF
jgi:hypothetical protein